MPMPVTYQRRNDYSKQYNFRLTNEEAAKLDKKLQDENITLPELIRRAVKGRRKVNADPKGN